MAQQFSFHLVRPVHLNPVTGLTFDGESAHDKPALLNLTAQGAGTVASADQANVNSRGVQVGINVTALTGTTPTVTVTVQGRDAASGTYYTLLASAAISATGFTLLTVYPGLTAAANSVASQVLPATWRVIATVAGTAPAATLTVGASMVN